MRTPKLAHAAAEVRAASGKIKAGDGGGEDAQRCLRRATQVLGQVEVQSPEVRGDWKVEIRQLHGEFQGFADQLRRAPVPFPVMEQRLQQLQRGWLTRPTTRVKFDDKAPGWKSSGIKLGEGNQAGTLKGMVKAPTLGSKLDGVEAFKSGSTGFKVDLKHKVEKGWDFGHGWPAKISGPQPKADGNDVSVLIDGIFALQWAISAGTLLSGEGAGEDAQFKAMKPRMMARIDQAVSYAGDAAA